MVTIVGDFPGDAAALGGTRCRFGERDVPVLTATAEAITCLTPPHTPAGGVPHGSVAISLTFDAGALYSSANPPLTFRFYVHRLSACAPRGGPTAGGTTLSVTGSGFGLYGRADAVRARLTWPGGGLGGGLGGSLGGDSAQALDLGAAAFVGTHGATFVTPPSARPGTAVLSSALNAVEGHAGDYFGGASAPISFRLYSPPKIDALRPPVGPVVGRTLLTIAGVGL